MCIAYVKNCNSDQKSECLGLNSSTEKKKEKLRNQSSGKEKKKEKVGGDGGRQLLLCQDMDRLIGQIDG